MNYNEYEFKAKLWLYEGAAAWHFLTIPTQISEDIKRNFGALQRGWGSLPVRTSIGATTWETSIFPDKKLQAYLLPIKAEVRKKERVVVGDVVTVFLVVRE